MIRPRLDGLPLWPGLLLGAVSDAAIALAGHLLGTVVPPYLMALDDAHDIDFTTEPRGDPMTVVPAKTKLAAKRGFIRTTAQAYAATIPAGGISAAVLANTIEDPKPVQLVATVAAWLLAPLCAGAASYLSLISSGIPDEYVDAAQ